MTMKAVRIHTYGGPGALTYEDAARPEVAQSRHGRGKLVLQVCKYTTNPTIQEEPNDDD